jgi:protoheme ferro-lyase
MMTQQYAHPKRKTKVVFVQLGSPSEPTAKALRKYLRAFLGDPRVVDINPWLWKMILNFFFLCCPSGQKSLQNFMKEYGMEKVFH